MKVIVDIRIGNKKATRDAELAIYEGIGVAASIVRNMSMEDVGKNKSRWAVA
jgi:hypothetical protein